MDPVRRVNTTMPASLLRRVDLYSQMNLEDRATAIRQLVAEGLRVKMEQTVVEQFRRGKITVRQGAELLGISYFEMDEVLRENQVAMVSDLTLALRRRGRGPGQRAGKRRAPAWR